jgi:Leucine-rich repeat (LRR) protein
VQHHMGFLRSGFGRPAMFSLAAILALALLSQQMSGAAAFDVSFLQGCPEFNNVTNLDLYFKKLEGPIPPEIGKCTALVSLNISSNSQVSGQIPPEIGRLSNLRVLKLGLLDGLKGSIPPEIGNLSQLEELDLSLSRSLSGAIPPELCRLSRLQTLKLAYTNLTGPFPECLGNLARLENLDLGGTSGLHTSGKTLGVVSLLANLTSLKMSKANISGSIPSGIGNLTKLQELDLSYNNLSLLSTDSLAGLGQIQKLDLSYNGISGPFPSESVCQLSDLNNLNLGGNNFTGPIPACLANLSGMRFLQLDRNRLSGSIPGDLGLLPNLTYLSMGSNLLSGTIPSELAKSTKLSTLNLRNNSLSGPIPPQLVNLTSLGNLELSHNQLSGPLPAFTNMSQSAGAVFLKLGSNNLSGPIPPSLGSISGFSSLDLSFNQLTGEIPVVFSTFSALGVLDLGHNNLQGPVTPLANLSKVTYLDLTYNSFSGTIPPSLFVGRSGVFLSHNNFSGPIPREVAKLQPAFSLTDAPYLLLDLSSNQLSGSPPPELQELSTLLQLNLSNNNLSGSFRVGPFRRSPVYSALLDFSNNGPLAMLPGTNFSGLQVVALPNLTSKDPPLIAPDMRVLQLSGGVHKKGLDLSAVPETCPYVTYTQGPVSDITFWDACTGTTGCLVNLVGTGSKLSRDARKMVCLNRISVILEGDPPALVFPFQSPLSPYLNNSRGPYFFNDSRFIDKIDLGKGGVAYTGVGFARVQEGNLCGNPEAKMVVAVTYGVFAGLILLSSLGWWVAARLGFTGKGDSPGRKTVVTLGLYIWSIICALLPWGTLASNVTVVADIWGAWSAWVVLASILAPYLVSAACVAWIWWGYPTSNSILKVRNEARVIANARIAIQ